MLATVTVKKESLNDWCSDTDIGSLKYHLQFFKKYLYCTGKQNLNIIGCSELHKIGSFLRKSSSYFWRNVDATLEVYIVFAAKMSVNMIYINIIWYYHYLYTSIDT